MGKVTLTGVLVGAVLGWILWRWVDEQLDADEYDEGESLSLLLQGPHPIRANGRA